MQCDIPFPRLGIISYYRVIALFSYLPAPFILSMKQHRTVFMTTKTRVYQYAFNA